MIIINVQRGGPSTGLPTKTEQADLFQAMFGRNGECPMPVIAARSPADCFDVAQEAWRIAARFMTPVIAADRRLHRQRLRAVADSGRRAACRRSQSSIPARSTNGEAVPALRARRTAGPPLGPARHARPDAPHRRPGKAGHHRQRQLRPGQPPAHDRRCGPRRSRTSPTTFRCRRSTGPRAATCWCSAGAAPTAPARPPCDSCQTAGHVGRPRPPALPESVPDAIWARSCAATSKVLIPELNHGPAAHADPRPVTWSTRSA